MAALKTAYLALYNAASAVAWGYILTLAYQHLAHNGSPETLYPVLEFPLKVVQTAAFLEVLHAALGLVRSSVFTTALQVASRLLVLWGIVHVAPPSQTHWAFALMALSWGLVEVPRYSYYVWGLLGKPPRWMTWLRYSLFMILYPTGISGEIGCLWNSLEYIRDHKVGEWALPNTYNLAFSWWLTLWVILVAVYPAGSYVMYTHMLRQRRKMLAPAEKNKAS